MRNGCVCTTTIYAYRSPASPEAQPGSMPSDRFPAQGWHSCWECVVRLLNLVETARKLGVSFFDYVHDRILGTNVIPRLDILLTDRAATMWLSPTWINS